MSGWSLEKDCTPSEVSTYMSRQCSNVHVNFWQCIDVQSYPTSNQWCMFSMNMEPLVLFICLHNNLYSDYGDQYYNIVVKLWYINK